jgi:hypothetical protein
MRMNYEVEESQDAYERIVFLVRMNPWAWQSIGAISGLLGGVLVPVLGSLLIAVAWFIHSPEFSVLNVLIIGLFTLTIPLLVGGAHCLDLLERKTSEVSVYEPRLEKGVAGSLAFRAQGQSILVISKQPMRQ